jgi:hypothetical protein
MNFEMYYKISNISYHSKFETILKLYPKIYTEVQNELIYFSKIKNISSSSNFLSMGNINSGTS